MSRIACKIVLAFILLTLFSHYGTVVSPFGAGRATGAALASSYDLVYDLKSHRLSGKDYWNTIAVSSDGTKIVASDGDSICTSADSGVTWKTPLESSFGGVVSSSDGARLVAGGAGGYIYTSDNSGATWTKRKNVGNQDWGPMASSSDGIRLVAAASEPTCEDCELLPGYIYTSADSGVTWVRRANAGKRFWNAVASSSDGTRLVAAAVGAFSGESDTWTVDYIYTSTDSGATWTKIKSAGRHCWTAVTLSADGTKIAAAAGSDTGAASGCHIPILDYVYTSTDSGATWTQRTGSGARLWTQLASSSDGAVILAVADSVYMSSDYGATWAEQTGAVGQERIPRAVASSSDGTILFSGDYYGYIHRSSDSGASWTQLLSPGKPNYISVASSADGTRVVAAVEEGDSGFIYTSADSGATWARRTGAGDHNWTAVASSSDGVTLLAAASSEGSPSALCVSKDSGATWTEQPVESLDLWSAVACSADGTLLIAVDNAGTIARSVDSGKTWSSRVVSGFCWTAVALSSDGTRIVISDFYGYFYTSADSGATWTTQADDGTQEWQALASSSDGTRLVAADYGRFSDQGGYIYTSGDSGATWTVRTSAGKRSWVALASSSDGTRLVAADDGSRIYVSGDSGVTWIPQAQGEGTSLWLSPDGSKLVAGAALVWTGSARATSAYISSPTVSSVTATSAVLGATIDSGNTPPVRKAGIAYGLNEDPGIEGSKAASAVKSGSFTTSVTDLTSNTVYYFRGYLTNSKGTGYTANATFTTISKAPKAAAPSWEYYTSFNANWTSPPGKAEITEYRLDVATDADFKSPLAGYTDLPVSGLTRTISGLSGGKNYYYRVRAVNNGGTSGNSNVVKAALPLPPVIIVTSPAGGESWEAGSKHTIKWTYSGNTGSKVDIDLAASVYTPVKLSASIGSKGAGSCSWKIPPAQPPGSGYKILITTVNRSGFGESANAFTITEPATAKSSLTGTTANPAGVTGPAIILTSPAAGENRQTESEHPLSCPGLQSSAGPDQKVKASAPVELNGSNSVGCSGKDIASYQWKQTGGPQVSLSNPSAAETDFVAPDAGMSGTSLSFELTVATTNGAQSKDTCLVNVVRDSPPPTADAGPAQTVPGARIVRLDGSRSAAPDGGMLSYAWKQISGAQVDLGSPASAQPTFVAPDAQVSGESLVFELTVTDRAGLRSRDTCLVSVISQNQPPVADAGSNQTVRPGTGVVLDGTGSSGEDGAVVSYNWKQLAGTPVTLSDPTEVTPTFTAPVTAGGAEELVFELFVTDAAGLLGSAKTTVFVKE